MCQIIFHIGIIKRKQGIKETFVRKRETVSRTVDKTMIFLSLVSIRPLGEKSLHDRETDSALCSWESFVPFNVRTFFDRAALVVILICNEQKNRGMWTVAISYNNR